MNDKTIAEIFKTERKLKNISQKKLAAILKTTSSTICRIETRQVLPYNDLISRFAEYFGLEVKDLFIKRNEEKEEDELRVSKKIVRRNSRNYDNRGQGPRLWLNKNPQGPLLKCLRCDKTFRSACRKINRLCDSCRSINLSLGE